MKGKEIEIKVWQCEKCKKNYKDQLCADSCCAPIYCSYCHEVMPDKYYMAIHQECVVKKRLANSEKITEWDGWVYEEAVGNNEGYFESIGDLIEHYENELILDELPKYVSICQKTPFRGVDAYSVVGNICEDMYEDAIDNIVELKELADFVDNWNKKQTIFSVTTDYKKMLIVPRMEIWKEFVKNFTAPLDDETEMKNRIEKLINSQGVENATEG